MSVVRGQFSGYCNEAGVKPDSKVETYIALRLYINSWRWKGVPFYIRAGKSLPITATEVIVTLLSPPDIFLDNSLPANYVRFRVTPDLTIAIGSHVKVPGDRLLGKQVELVISSSSDPHEMQAYEELLGDALVGNSSRFARQHYVEEAWRIVDPVLDTQLRFISIFRVPGDRSRRIRYRHLRGGSIPREIKDIAVCGLC